jgi:hypothetical protein
VGNGHIAAGDNIAPLAFGRDLEEFDQMKTLVVGIVVIIQFVRVEQAEILMAPGEVAHIRSAPVHLLLQHPIIDVGSVGRQLLEELGAQDELITRFSGILDGFFKRNLPLILGSARRPRTGFFAPVDPKLQGDPTGDAPETHREFFIVLKLGPVDEAVVIPMIVHQD